MPDWVSDILQAGDFDHARNMIKENEVRDTKHAFDITLVVCQEAAIFVTAVERILRRNHLTIWRSLLSKENTI